MPKLLCEAWRREDRAGMYPEFQSRSIKHCTGLCHTGKAGRTLLLMCTGGTINLAVIDHDDVSDESYQKLKR